ncbi:CHAP domain-containing protein [Enterococcus casseliflavus]|uniref:CHAP domain-containing protein n=1 Tax=Enterococcus TaxID=1350 RepID=UPI002DBF2970|nr:CHAP domain-containing protein [Enterococcus casseliflavus]MEB8399686.1 CHAP domain-containing protein [Enterococcus casseliflavus]
MGVSINTVLTEARKLIGTVMGTTAHHNIVDLYNATKPLPVGYKAKYTDDWCDITVSVIGIKAGATDLIGRECGVQRHIDIFKSKGIWIEDGKATPKPGDIVVFNWDDVTQPNDGWADHIGFVESVSNGVITTIEGNYGRQVKRRAIPVGWGYIRGYARPSYDASASSGGIAGQKTIETIAKEVINGAWGNGDNRKKKLAAAGYSYDAVQKKVTELLKGFSSNQASTNPFSNITVNDKWDTDLNKYLQRYYGLKTVDGIISGQIKGTWNAGITGITFGTGGSDLVAAIQKDLGITVDRNMGPGTIGSMQSKAGTTKDKEITNPSALAKKIKQNLKSKGKPW